MSNGRRSRNGNGQGGGITWQWYMAFTVSLLFSVGSLGYSSGVLATRVNSLETSVSEVKIEQKVLVQLAGDVRVVAEAVKNIGRTVDRLELRFGEGKRN